MRVLHIFNEINYSGAEIMYANAVPVFKNSGIEMSAISTGKSIGSFNCKFMESGIRTYHLPFPANKYAFIKRLKYFIRFYKFINHKNIDVLHIHRSDIYSLGFIAKLIGIPTLKTMHNHFKNRPYTRHYAIMKRWIARKMFKITFQTISDSVCENELNYYKNPSIKINNWYDSTRFYPATNQNEKRSLKNKLGLNEDSFVIVSVGGCSHVKNHNDIIKAISTIPRTVDIKYIHLGTGDTLNEEIQLSKDLGVYHNIHFCGNIDNVRDYLIVSDAFVMPSKHEGLSIALLEAMACGLPTILYNSTGLNDLAKNDDCGFLINPDYRLIGNKILEFFNHPKLINNRGKSAIKIVNQKYSMNKNVREIVRIYKSLLKNIKI